MAPSVATRLHAQRRNSGLTQREVANIVGLESDTQIFRHENKPAIPPLLIAIGYEILYQKPLSELFPGLYDTVRQSVEANVAELEKRLQQSTAKGRQAELVAHKLEWICMRRSPTANDLA